MQNDYRISYNIVCRTLSFVIPLRDYWSENCMVSNISLEIYNDDSKARCGTFFKNSVTKLAYRLLTTGGVFHAEAIPYY